MQGSLGCGEILGFRTSTKSGGSRLAIWYFTSHRWREYARKKENAHVERERKIAQVFIAMLADKYVVLVIACAYFLAVALEAADLFAADLGGADLEVVAVPRFLALRRAFMRLLRRAA